MVVYLLQILFLPVFLLTLFPLFHSSFLLLPPFPLFLIEIIILYNEIFNNVFSWKYCNWVVLEGTVDRHFQRIRTLFLNNLSSVYWILPGIRYWKPLCQITCFLSKAILYFFSYTMRAALFSEEGSDGGLKDLIYLHKILWISKMKEALLFKYKSVHTMRTWSRLYTHGIDQR